MRAQTSVALAALALLTAHCGGDASPDQATDAPVADTAAAGGDVAVDVPETDAALPADTTCAPCLSDDECAAGAACLPVGDGSFCLATGCDVAPGAAATCPVDAPCQAVGESAACVPAKCPCTAAGEGRATRCRTAEGCAGTRVCSAAAFGACNGPPPKPEVCNGLDDDCSGTPDDGGADAACGDGVSCTVDHCVDGECSYVVEASHCLIGVSCWSEGELRPGAPCETCQPAVSAETWTPKPDGAACDDGTGCTNGDQCTSGTCTGIAMDCSDTLACTVDACVAGECQTHVLAPETCLIDGQCRASGEHNPASPCLACVPAVSTKGWSVLAKGTSCDDGNACTDGDACDGLQCDGAPKACAPSGPCAQASCQDGQCVDEIDPLHCLVDGACYDAGASAADTPCRTCQPEVTKTALMPAAATCSDGKLCTIQDHCEDGACVGGLAICKCESDADCQDGDLCNGAELCDLSSDTSTDWHCVPGKAPAPCPASAATCLLNACDPATGTCAAAPAPDLSPCEDGSACTANDACLGGTCGGTPISCDDGNACTTDSCDTAAGCVHAGAGGPCDDGNACTEGDACQDGECASGAVTCGCVADADCPATDPCLGHYVCEGAQCVYAAEPIVCDTSQDGACVTTVCAAGACVPAADPDGEPCDDGDACTEDDTCQGGGCAPGTDVDCDDGEDCTADTCDGGCQHAPLAIPCDDADPCTAGDACVDGACVAGESACECQKDADCPNDGDLCNGIAYCDTAGESPPMACSLVPGSVVTCAAGADPCQVVACVPSTGSCAASPASDGTACDDGKSCTTSDHCASGACTGSTTGCDDGLACTVDACSSAGCVHAVVPDACLIGGACWQNDAASPTNPCVRCVSDVSKTTWTPKPGACDDGSKCTPSDSCQAGQCAGAGVLDCDDLNQCTADACDPKSGCQHAAQLHPCDDGDACTTGDTCKDGKCAPGSGASCSDGNPCTDDGCDVFGCTHVPSAKVCDDGDACTTADTCQSSACKGGPAPSCDDKNPCTTDTCVAPGGCVHDPLTAVACEDGSLCTAGDVCQAGACKAGPPPNCDDVNICTADACKPSTGCTHDPVAGACDDGSKCTTSDACKGPVCTGGPPLGCDDGSPCTEDGCAPATGCTHVLSEDAPCNDNDSCTSYDHCVNGQCAGTPKACGDGDPCTTDGCANGACTYVKVACDDGNPCTEDSCGANGGCVNVANAAACDDLNPCTTTDKCLKGECKGSGTKSCDDKNVCTTDVCNTTTGCKHTYNVYPCDDGDACTETSVCQQGKCVGWTFDCDDGNDCTTDLCFGSLCVHENVFGSCAIQSADCLLGYCIEGQCLKIGEGLCDDGNTCTSDACVDGKCEHKPVSGIACYDSDECTCNDKCLLGQCMGTWCCN